MAPALKKQLIEEHFFNSRVATLLMPLEGTLHTTASLMKALHDRKVKTFSPRAMRSLLKQLTEMKLVWSNKTVNAMVRCVAEWQPILCGRVNGQ